MFAALFFWWQNRRRLREPNNRHAAHGKVRNWRVSQPAVESPDSFERNQLRVRW
jgi:hypothetical protein